MHNTSAAGPLDAGVPSISLEAALRDAAAGRDVAFAKIDAQGLDVAVLRSAGPALARVKAVQLEVVRDRPPIKCNVQYAGAEDSKCAVAALARMG